MGSVGHVHYPNKEVLGLILIVWAGDNQYFILMSLF